MQGSSLPLGREILGSHKGEAGSQVGARTSLVKALAGEKVVGAAAGSNHTGSMD